MISAKIFGSVVLALASAGCGKLAKQKDSETKDGPSPGETTQASPTKSALGDQLYDDLLAYGLTAEQTAALVDAGKKSPGSALADTGDPTIQFLAAVLKAVPTAGIDAGLLPGLGGVIAGASEKVTLGSLANAATTPEAAAELAGQIAGSVTRSFDEMGVGAEKLEEAVAALSRITATAVLVSGLPEDVQLQVLPQIIEGTAGNVVEGGAAMDHVASAVAIASFNNFEVVVTISGDRKAELGGVVAKSAVDGASRIEGFSDLPGLIGEVSGAMTAPLFEQAVDGAAVEPTLKAIASGLIAGSEEFEGVDLGKLADVTKAMTSGFVRSGAGQTDETIAKITQVAITTAAVDLADRPDFDHDKASAIVASGAEGAMLGGRAVSGFTGFAALAAAASGAAVQAAAALTVFDVARLPDLAGLVSMHVVKATPVGADVGEIAKSSAQQIISSAAQIPAFDAQNLTELSQKLASGAATGAATIASLDPTKISDLSSSIVHAVVETATTSFADKTATDALQTATQTVIAATSTATLAFQKCVADLGTWIAASNECKLPSATSAAPAPFVAKSCVEVATLSGEAATLYQASFKGATTGAVTSASFCGIQNSSGCASLSFNGIPMVSDGLVSCKPPAN